MRRKPMPNALDIDLRGGLTDQVTPSAGAALLIDAMRRAGVPAAAERHVPAKRSQRGLGQGAMVETFVLLSALGGDCLDDLDHLRRDMGLAALAGYTLPAASTARQWLDRFHEPELLEGRPAQGAFIPMESAGLAGLREVVVTAVRAFVAAVPVEDEVTLDVDAHLVESSKATALPTYEGFRGFQPALVSWAETGLVLADQFRDGNVGAQTGLRELVDEAFSALPSGREWKVSVRSDSAAYQGELLDHWAGRRWRFAVSADMSPQLRAEVVALPNEAWHGLSVEPDGFVREWAEVPYVPTRASERKDSEPYRYVAIRVRPPQGILFGDGQRVRHFAVVTNDWETPGGELITWHRGKQGTIEHVHRTLKDELGAGVYPSARHGANAAWLRLQVLTLDLLELLKAVALDKELRNARPKRLRFRVFTQFGRVVHHARTSFVRVVSGVLAGLLRPGLRRLALATWPPGA
ncbi:MAG: IS1380 family transposase [Actinomycetota bacterium]|nr:IS1380 family transposase [Actinomycetota bacterium]